MMLIVNPVAGKGEMMRNIAEVTGIFMDAGYTVSLFPTKGRGDATEFVKAYAKDFDCYNFSGGFRFYDAVTNDRCLIESTIP